MMENLVFIIKIVYYLLFVFALFFYARYKYKKDQINKFGIIALVFFAILFGFYSVICGSPEEHAGDRHRYAFRFETAGQEMFVKNTSLGLYGVESIVQIFTRDSNVLFFVVSVVYFCINIYCYKKLKAATPIYLLLFFLSTLGLFGFYALKQALSLAFMNLALTEYLQKKRVLALAFLVVAILFHEAAWIAVPCFVLAKYCKGSKTRQLLMYVGTIVIAIFFPQISKVFVSLFNHIPGMAGQISSYVDESGSISIDVNIFTILKGIPYYMITFVALLYRKQLKDKIDNYEFLLVLSMLCSVFSVLSMYMYWMFRFAMYCYIPCFLLASQLSIYLKERNVKLFRVFIAGTLLVLMIKSLIQYYFLYGGMG